MSSSLPDFHLDPAKPSKESEKKLGKSFCEPGNLQGNVAIQLARDVVFPLNGFKGKKFI
jgi:hypothetical protein